MKPSMIHIQPHIQPHIQHDLQQFILGLSNIDSVSPYIADKPGLQTTERLEIYYNAYRARLREAMSEAFDKTHQYLGDALFYECCAAYIESNPSVHRNLRWYGAQFPRFLLQYLPEHPAIAELATFEWALSLAFDAPDQAILTFEQCRNLPASAWESIGFTLQDSVQFISLQHNSVAIWLALVDEHVPPEALRHDSAKVWLIWRKNLQAHFRSLSAQEHQALLELADGQSFANVCANAAQQNPAATEQIAGWLQTWVNEEVLCGL